MAVGNHPLRRGGRSSSPYSLSWRSLRSWRCSSRRLFNRTLSGGLSGAWLAAGLAGSVGNAILGGFRMSIRALALRDDPATTAIERLTLSAAGQTGSTAVQRATGAVSLGVFWRQFVTAFAVSEPGMKVPSISDCVGGVLTARAPSQVAQTVIGWIVVQVPRLHSRRARPNESFQDQAVNRPVDPSFKDHVPMVCVAQLPRLQHSARYPSRAAPGLNDALKRANKAGVADLVTPFKTGDGNPPHD